MSRYRKVDPRTWGDSKFRHLSDNAKLLWFYLLTGPEVTSLPGVILIGRKALAEALRKDEETFQEAFGEVFGKGMVEADWEARFIWLPNSWKYNKPESPNVVKSWKNHWDAAPECELKDKAYKVLKAFAEGLGKGFRKAFREAFDQPLPNQEQEQEQEQDSLFASSVDDAEKIKEPKTRKRIPRDDLFDIIVELTGKDISIKSNASEVAKAAQTLIDAIPPYTPEELRMFPAAMARNKWDFAITPGSIVKNIGAVRNSPKKTANNGQYSPPTQAEIDQAQAEKVAKIRAERERQAQAEKDCVTPEQFEEAFKRAKNGD